MSSSDLTDEDGTLILRRGHVEEANASTAESRPAVSPGARLGRYLVIEEIGRGGMGVVVRAYDPKLQREVALKLLRTKALGEEAQARLVREARVMARLSHPNIVAVYDVELALRSAGDDETSPGVVLVMEYVPGTSLRRWLQENSPSYETIVEAFVAAGRGLSAAHAEGVLHRDFKPDNVLVEPDGSGPQQTIGRVRVTDFGLARPATPDGWRQTVDPDDGPRPRDRPVWDGWPSNTSGSTVLTEAGTVMGTPPYMAPEQMEGREVDARADQYAFCVSLWEALAGRRPFEGEKDAMVEAKRAGTVQWPSNVSVPRHIVDALRRGLRPRPEQRWPTLEDLLTELGRDPRRRRRRAIAFTLLGVAPLGAWGVHQGLRARALSACAREGESIAEVYDDARADEIGSAFEATGIAFASDTWTRSRERLDAYARQWANARSQICEQAEIDAVVSRQTADMARDCLDEHADQLRALLGQLVEPDEATVQKAATATASLPRIDICTDPKRLALRAEPPEDPAIRSQLRTLRTSLAQASAARATGRYEDALQRAQDVLERARELDWPPIEADAQREVGEAQAMLAQYDEAAATLEQAFYIAGAAGHDELALDLATTLMFVIGGQVEDLDRAMYWGRLGEMLVERLELSEALAGARLLNSFAVVHQNRGELDRAREVFERSIELKQRVLGSHHPEVAAALGNLGLALHGQAKYDQALEKFEQSLEIFEKALGPRHPHVATMLNSIGVAYQNKGAYEEAIDHYERSLALAEQAVGPEHLDVALALNNLGLTYATLGDYEKAAPLFERAVAIMEKTLGPDHPDVATALGNLGSTYKDVGTPDEAVRLLERALTIMRKARSSGPDVANVLLQLGVVQQEMGAPEQARANFEESIEMLESSLGPEHPHLAMVLYLLGQLQYDQGEWSAAVDTFERTLKIREAKDRPPSELARTRFALARALWDSGDQQRARELATLARDTHRQLGDDAADDLAEIETWLAAHGSP